jgi:sulfate transport system ATP-binding protein
VLRAAPGTDGALPAQLLRRYSRGANVLLELQRAGSADPIEVELSRERAEELQLTPGEQVLVRPRALRVFAQQ